MKKLLITLMILGLGVTLAYANTGPQAQGVVITSGQTLSIKTLTAISYSLSSPTESGDETVATPASGGTVTLVGNKFTNTAIQPYLTVSMSGTVTNAQMIINGISVTTQGTVQAQPATAGDIVLSALPQNYAMPVVGNPPTGTTGTISGSHSVIIRKAVGGVPANIYSLSFLWTGYDSGI